MRGSSIVLPCHLPGPDEAERRQLSKQLAAEVDAPDSAAGTPPPEEVADGLDTRLFYLQEYPRRPAVSPSHQPRFMSRPDRHSGSHPEHEGGILQDVTPKAPKLLEGANARGCGWLS